jgi:transcriptional regulator with XRE-family HTH domain
MTPQTIKARKDRLRLSVRELATRAGVHEDSVHRIFKGSNVPLLTTFEALDGALRVEEQKLFDYLNELLFAGGAAE